MINQLFANIKSVNLKQNCPKNVIVIYDNMFVFFALLIVNVIFMFFLEQNKQFDDVTY